MNRCYRDKVWLDHQYSVLKKSYSEIARMCKCSQSNLMYWVHKLDVVPRSNSESQRIAKSWLVNHVSLSAEALSFLDGLLLGDGYLRGDAKRPSSSYQHGSKYKAYVEWLSKEFAKFGIDQSGKIRKRNTGWGVVYDYQSRYYAELKHLWRKWYRKATEGERKKRRKFIKIIPNDLKLTPLTCRQWYIDDGTFFERDKSIKLYTLCFNDDEVRYLISLLENLDIRATKHVSNTIYIWKESAKDFLDYIGLCPVEIGHIYGYKWEVN